MNLRTADLDNWLGRALELTTLLFCVGMLLDGREAPKNIGFYITALIVLLRLLRAPTATLAALVRAPLALPLAALLAAGLWGSLAAPDPGASWTRFFHRDNIGSAAVMALMVGAVRFSPGQAQRLVICCLAVFAVANIRQIAYLAEHPVFLHPDAYPYSVLWTAREFGELLLLMAPWVWALPRLFSHRLARPVAIIWSALIVLLLLPAGYRGSYLGLVAGMLVWFGAHRHWKPLLAGLGAVAVIAATVHVVLPGSLLSRALERGGDDNLRVEGIWKPTAALIRERPLAGYGFDDAEFRRAYVEARRSHPAWPLEAISDTHSNALAFVASAGVPGGLAYLFAVLGVVIVLLRRVRRPGPGDPVLPLALLASWCATYGVLGQLDIVNWNYFGFLLVASTVLAGLRNDTGDAQGRRVLFVIRDKLGDSLLAFATVRSYLDARPRDEVTVLMRQDYAQLVAGEAGFRLVRYRGGAQALLWAIGQRLWVPPYDAVVVLRGFGGRLAQIGRLLPARRKISFSATQRKVFAETPPPFADDDWPLIDASWRAAAILEPALPRPDSLDLPSLYRDGREQRFIGICPVTDEKRKDLTPVGLACLVEHIRSGSDLPIKILVRGGGSAFDLPGCEVVEFGDLSRLCRLYRQMAAYYGADTGLYHLAVAMNIPATVVFGPTQPKRVILPRQRAASVRLSVLGDTHCDVKQCDRPLCVEQACANLMARHELLPQAGLPAQCPLRAFPAAALAENRRLQFPADPVGSRVSASSS